MYIYCQEKQQGIVPEGTSCFASGKVCWLDLETAKKEYPQFIPYFKEKPSHDRLEQLKKDFKECLEMKGFVFFSEVLYRYKVSTSGNLKEYGISYFKID
jgi:hypothetical protein